MACVHVATRGGILTGEPAPRVAAAARVQPSQVSLGFHNLVDEALVAGALARPNWDRVHERAR